jgi:hypothetical protein
MPAGRNGSTLAAGRERVRWKELVPSVGGDFSHTDHTHPIGHVADAMRISQLGSGPLGFDSHRPL